MNASQLYVGDLYAYVEDPPRGRTPLGAAMVRLRGQESRKSTWDTNRRTYAYITVVRPGNAEGGYYGRHAYCKEGQELTVPARHLIDFWEDYEAEANLLLKDREESRKARRRSELTQQVLTSAITWKLQHEVGVPLTVAMLDLYDDGSGFLKFQLEEVLDWLKIDREEVHERVSELMED